MIPSIQVVPQMKTLLPLLQLIIPVDKAFIHHLPLGHHQTSKLLHLKLVNPLLKMAIILFMLMHSTLGPCMKSPFQLMTSQSFLVS